LVFILSDKTMPSMVHCQTGKGCPEIIRVDNGAIRWADKGFPGCDCTAGLNIPPVRVALSGYGSLILLQGFCGGQQEVFREKKFQGKVVFPHGVSVFLGGGVYPPIRVTAELIGWLNDATKKEGNGEGGMG
jgi:hypothetical protein